VVQVRDEPVHIIKEVVHVWREALAVVFLMA
jgi:hypothetical protein